MSTTKTEERKAAAPKKKKAPAKKAPAKKAAAKKKEAAPKKKEPAPRSFNSSFAQAMKEIRVQWGRTPEHMAEKMGVSYDSYTRLERGSTAWSIEHCVLFCSALGILPSVYVPRAFKRAREVYRQDR